jgi:predicted MFS family arabinose efflux permease
MACASSFALLLFVTHAEMGRRFQGLVMQRLAAGSRQIAAPLERHLDLGSTLSSFGGFPALVDGLRSADAAVTGVRVIDEHGRSPAHLTRGVVPDDASFRELPKGLQVEGYRMSQSDTALRLSLPLRSRFGSNGNLVLGYDRGPVDAAVWSHFRVIVWAAIGGLGIICIVGSLRRRRRRDGVLLAVIAGVFLLIGCVAIGEVLDLYRGAILETAETMAQSMADRLGLVAELDLDWQHVRGLDVSLREFVDQDTIIAGAQLSDAGSVIAAAGETVGVTAWDVSVPVEASDGAALRLRLDHSLMWEPIQKGIRAFLVLLVACGLLTVVVVDGASAADRIAVLWRADDDAARDKPLIDFTVGLRLVKPAYFLIIVMNCLSVAFLPQLVTELAVETGLPAELASLPFTGYYLFFALAMLPAGRLVHDGNLKQMMLFGCVCECVGLGLIALTRDYWLLTVARCISGVGQGVFLIGLQSYLLAITPTDRRTEGNAVKVVAKNAGSISGAAIGGLLIIYVGYQSIFTLAAVISLVVMAYVAGVVPRVSTMLVDDDRAPRAVASRSLIASAVRDREFVQTLLLIGLASKMTITGVVMFAGPLVLEQAGFGKETIGQTMMVYYACSMMTTKLVSRWVDSSGGHTRSVLFASTVVGAAGIALLGMLAGPDLTGVSSTWTEPFRMWVTELGGESLTGSLLVVAMMLTGISFGISAAPLITHVTKTPIAAEIGSKQATATYTVLERAGHVLGPIVVSQLFLWFPTGTAFAVFGGGMLLLGATFRLGARVQ